MKFKQPRDVASIQRLHSVFGTSLLRRNLLTGVDTLRVPAQANPRDLARLLAQHPQVEWAEEVRWRRLSDLPQAPLVPNDVHYGISQKWYYEVLGAPEAWGVETGEESVVIAILDSGVMCAHPDLADNMWSNPGETAGNDVDDDGNGFVDDIYGYDFVGAETGEGEPETAPDLPGDGDPCVKAGDASIGNGLDDDNTGQADAGVIHGTFVAGIAAAVTDNNLGVTGMCWHCRIMALRVANPEGWVRSNDTADAITYAARNRARVINLSLGGPEISAAERAAVDLAIDTFKAVVVGAAGNESRSPIAYPAQLLNVVAVGSSARFNTKGRASFSQWGTGAANDRSVDVVSPGVALASTSVISAVNADPGGATAGTAIYSSGSGTSFSAPLISGLVGLVLSRNPSLSPGEVQNILKRTAVPLGDDPSDVPDAGPNWAGAGLANAPAALDAAMEVAAPTPTVTATPATPTPIPTASGAPATATPTATGAPATPTPPPTPTITPAPGTPTATATPLPTSSRPQPLGPPSGVQLDGLGITLRWNVPANTTQYQIQVIPARFDGPSINLIRNVATSYEVAPPVFGAGPYVVLPGITYTWRIRATSAIRSIGPGSSQWGPWSPDFTFRTRSASSATISADAPANGGVVTTRTPTLQWADTDKSVFYYEIQVSKDSDFGAQGPVAAVYWELRHGGATTPRNSYAIPRSFPLEGGVTYFWRVRPRIQGDGKPVPWSETFSFAFP